MDKGLGVPSTTEGEYTLIDGIELLTTSTE